MTGATSEQIRVVVVDDQQMVRAGFRMVIDSQPDLTVVGEAGDGAAAVQLLRSTAADVVLMDIRMPGTDGLEATRQVTALPEAPRVVVLTTFDLDEYVVAAIGAGASGFLLKDAPPEEMLAAVRTVHAGDSVIAASSTRRLLQHVAPMLRGASSSAPGGGDDAALAEPPRVVVLTTFDLDEYVLAAIGAGASGFLLKDAPPEELLAAIRTVHAGESVIAPSSTRRLLQHVAPMVRSAVRPGGAEPPELADLTRREREVLVQMALGLANAEIAALLVVSETTVKTHVGRVLAKTGSRDRVQAVVLAYRTGLVQPADLLSRAR